MKALIAAGGHATRLRPITYSINKHLIPLANKPMIEYAVEKIVEAGIRDIAINVNPGESEIQRVVGDGSRWNANITYLEQAGGALGIAHTVLNASAWINGEPFIFYLGDNVILGSIKGLVERFERERLDCLLALSLVPDPQRFGVPEIKDGAIIRVIEKPKDPPSPYAVTGIYIYSADGIMKAVSNIRPSARGEYEISEAHTWLIDHGYRVGYEEITGWWKDTGKPDDLIEANSLLLKEMRESGVAPDAIVEEGAVIEGLVSVGSGSVIGRGSILRGPACIGSKCEIRGSEIGPGVAIGDGSVLQGVKIRESILMDGCKMVDCDGIVHSLVGRDSHVSGLLSSAERTERRLLLGDRASVS